MRVEQRVLTNTISRSYFDFKNCYTGGFILSHFTFQYKLHNINQTIDFRISLVPWIFKQDKQENKLNISWGTIILTVRCAFAERLWQNALKMEPMLFLNHKRHAEGQWDKAKNSHTSFKSMEFHSPQLWFCKMLLWVTQNGGFWVVKLFCQLLTPSRKAQRAGKSEPSCRPGTWEFPHLPHGTSSSTGIPGGEAFPGGEASPRQGSGSRVSLWFAPRCCWSEHCLKPALLMGAGDRGLSWLVLPASEIKDKSRAQNKLAYI